MLDRKEEKRREHRRKKYKFALVEWKHWAAVDNRDKYAVEHKENLMWKSSLMGTYEILCDDQPERVLKWMLKLLMENGDG